MVSGLRPAVHITVSIMSKDLFAAAFLGRQAVR